MRKKELKVVLTLSVPEWMTKTEARREVRTRLNEGTHYSNYYEHDGYDSDRDFRAKKVF